MTVPTSKPPFETQYPMRSKRFDDRSGKPVASIRTTDSANSQIYFVA
jgi:hypothetical protein